MERVQKVAKNFAKFLPAKQGLIQYATHMAKI
jgi:hypothetical protein